SYYGGDRHPSGTASLSLLEKTVIDPRLVDICRAPITTWSPAASGASSIDLKENCEGVPCTTEIQRRPLLHPHGRVRTAGCTAGDLGCAEKPMYSNAYGDLVARWPVGSDLHRKDVPTFVGVGASITRNGL